MKGNNTYSDLIVWQKAIDLVVEIYRLVSFLPKDENFVISQQMRRAAISIPSNIAEGQSRKSKKEFLNFLSIATGSKSELETQLIICCRLKYLKEKQIDTALKMCDEISKMIYALSETIDICEN